MRIVLLGPPGAGKAELSEKLSKQYGMPVITVNSVMQRAAAEPSELGRLAKEAMDMSRVSDELLLALLRIQIPQMDLSHGFLLVDFPKNAGQADVLDSVLNDLGAGIELVLNLDVDPDELMERLVGRITCDHCGAQYNTYINPPMVEGVCDACGARVVRRPDDYEETISNRLRVYEGQLGPLLQYYQLSDKLQRIAADQGIDRIWGSVKKIIAALPPPPAEATKPAPAEPPAAAAKGIARARKGKSSAKPVSKAATKTDADQGGRSKATAKKTVAKKAVAKKAPAKKVAAKKKAMSKKAVVKKAAPNKATVKKTASKKAVAKKVAVKKSASKKAVAKAAVKKSGAKKATAKKTATRKTAVAKTASKKAVARKKTTAKKTAAKKTSTAKKVVKKAAAKKAASRRLPASKASAKKTATRKAPAAKKKVAVKKKVAAKKKVMAKKKVAAKARKKTARR